LFVHSARNCASPAFRSSIAWGNDIVVVWAEDVATSDVRLRAAWLLARALAIRTSAARPTRTLASPRWTARIEAIRKQLANFEDDRGPRRGQVCERWRERFATRAARMKGRPSTRQLGLLEQHRSPAAQPKAAGA
jgi:hypothetical protein